MNLRQYAWFALLVALVFCVYSNHFQNSFHFDDSHTIESNVHIRSLSNLPKFFTDAHTFSNLPTHQVYRPVLTTTLAFDYVRGGGKPFAFHVTSFLLFLCLLWTMWRLYAAATDEWWISLAAVAIFAIHPAIAETINYIVQRGDLLSTLGVVAGLLMYARLPAMKRFGIYLIPVAAALLVKPPALVFPALLFAWVILFENPGDWRVALRAITPSLILCALMGWFLSMMTVGTFNPGGTPAALYRITQMYVSLYYFGAFFAPVHLTADSDWTVLPGLSDPRAWAGAAFLAAIVACIWYTGQRRSWRPVAFGLTWFLVALFPTAWMPLAEVMNDHRMFFPFIGLAMAVVWTVRLLTPIRTVAPIILALVLAAEARGTWLRNEVWRTEETLWRDAVEKSPENGRALMNYALTLMARGSVQEAIGYLERAQSLTPNYFLLEINLGIAYGAANRQPEAEQHFLKAKTLEPERYESYFYYGRWLREQGRNSEAKLMLQRAVECNAYAIDARQLYTQVLAEPAAPAPATAEAWLEESLRQYRAGRFRECIQAARKSLELRPGYAEAWNNIAAAHNSLREWKEGIQAADQALRFKPDFELARNNRAWAVSQQQAEQHR